MYLSELEFKHPILIYNFRFIRNDILFPIHSEWYIISDSFGNSSRGGYLLCASHDHCARARCLSFLQETSRPPFVDSRDVKRMLACPMAEMRMFSDPTNYRTRPRYTRFVLPFREIEGLIQVSTVIRTRTRFSRGRHDVHSSKEKKRRIHHFITDRYGRWLCTTYIHTSKYMVIMGRAVVVDGALSEYDSRLLACSQSRNAVCKIVNYDTPPLFTVVQLLSWLLHVATLAYCRHHKIGPPRTLWSIWRNCLLGVRVAS